MGLPNVDTLLLAPMGAEHLRQAEALSRAAGWPHRVQDWALILSRSRGVVALDGDRVVGTAMATPFGPVATMNMIIVHEAMRGRGLGRRIMERAMAALSPREWRLVATTDGLPLYEKLGFRVSGEVLQHQGIAQAASGGLPDAWAEAADAPALAALDCAATGMKRAGLIGALLREGRVLVLREAGEAVAFAALRPFGLGEVAGPVVARTGEEARALLATLLSRRAGRFLRVDTTRGTDLGDFLADHGLPYAGGGIAMSRGAAEPALGPQRRFALAAQALG